MYNHPFVEKYNPENYQPEVYDFMADFNNEEIQSLLDAKTQQGTTAALTMISNLVNAKYKYKKRIKGRSALEPNFINNTKQIDCYGHAIATAQILELIGIDHKIAFANTHSFALVQDNKDYYIVDSFLPCITGILTEKNICHPECLRKGIFSVNMLQHALDNCHIPDQDHFLRTNSWIQFSNNIGRLNSSGRENIRPNKNPSLITRLYEPTQGIRALYSFDDFKVSTENNRLTRGYLMSKELVATYPEIDIRNKPKTAEILVEKLGKLALTTLASHTIDNISAGLQKTETIAPMLWRADQYAKLSRYASKQYFLFKSKNILESLLAENKLNLAQKELIIGKLSKNYKNLP